ncbi:hypothetical protein HYX09_04845, partial [Candidatus Woesearchaeota archaeon]|nr:hypothetical protein [Candidatus Woesearchaeota archaeon]
LDGKHIEEVTLKFGDGETARNVPYEYQRFVYNEVEGDPNTQKIGIRLRRKNSDKPWLPFVYNQETDSWLFWYNPQSKDKRIKKHQQDIRDGKEPVELKLLRALHAKRPEWKGIDIRAEDVLDRNVDVRDIKLVNARGTKTDPNDPGVRHTADFWMPKRRLFQRFADDPSITFHDTETGADVRARITDMNLLFNKFLAFGDANAETDASIEKYDIIVSEQPIIGESVEDVRSILEIAELIQSNGLANYQVPVMAGVVDGKAVLVYDRTEGGIKLTPENVREVRQRIEAEEEVTDAVGDAAEASIRRGSRFDDMPVIERYKLMEGDVGYAIRRLQLRNEISSDADINPEIMARIQEIGLERIASRQGDKVAMLNEFYGELGRFADDLYAEDAWLDFRTEVQQPALLSHINILPESSPLKGILSEMVLVDVPLLNSELAATDMNSIQTRAYAFIRAERNAGTMLSQFYNEFNALQDSIGIRRVPKQSHFIEALTEDSTFGQTLKTWVDSGQIDISPSSEMLPDGIPRTRAQLDALAASMEVLGRSGGESFRAKLREFKARINAELSRVVEVTSVEFGGQVVTDTRIINLADRLKQRLIADGETRLTPERIAQIKSSLKNTILKPISDEIFGALGTVQPDGSIEVDATSNGLPGTTPGQPVKLKEARRGSPWHVEYSDTSGQVIGRIESSEDLEKVSINPETDEKIAAFNDFIDALPETEGAETETLPLAEGEYVVPSLVLKVLNAISNNIEFDESADVLGDVYLSSNPIPGSIWNFLPFMESKANRFGRLLEDEFTETEIGRFYELASTPGNILLSEEGSSRARHFNARMQRLMNEYLTDEEKTVLQDSFNNFYLIDFVASQAQRSWMDFYAYMGQIENYPDETPNPSPDVYYSLKQDFPAAIKIYNRLLIAVSIIGNELPAQEGVSDEILFRLAVDEEILRIKRIGGAIQEGLLTNFDLFYYTLNDGIVLKGDRGCAEKGVCSSGICYDNSGQCMVCRMPISYYEEDGSAADDIRFYKKVDNRACQAITENENPAFNIESVSYSKDETEESIVTMMSYRLSFTTPEGYGSTWEIDYSIKVDFTEITGEYATVSNIRETKGTFKKAEEFIEEINGPGHKIYHFTDDNQNNAMEPDEFYLSVQDNSGGRERIMTRHEFTEEEIGEIRQEFENQLRAATTT